MESFGNYAFIDMCRDRKSRKHNFHTLCFHGVCVDRRPKREKSKVHSSVESNLCLLWFFSTTLVIGSNKLAPLSQPIRNKTNPIARSRLARTHFPALDASYMYLLRILIGPLRCLCLLSVIGHAGRLFWNSGCLKWKVLQ